MNNSYNYSPAVEKANMALKELDEVSQKELVAYMSALLEAQQEKEKSPSAAATTKEQNKECSHTYI